MIGKEGNDLFVGNIHESGRFLDDLMFVFGMSDGSSPEIVFVERRF